ncbi:hypothetical protein DS884_10760 [Tenacibaculum sp. E3R01]|uniref:hypothetical protein n=1 Tax=Tenacibaculum sp. E3R01 TaxID=2267227 RepID=UPI000DEA0960|nr:hypothetical protein [Tenacibaculum sp. E3R01]RBW57528.1 hypothetical protein DS884_10760 [Tenacibaculum sp. E3R01]
MNHKRKGLLTTIPECAKHLRKIGKRFFWKGERVTEKRIIEKNIYELDIKSLSESEVNRAEKLYEYLNSELPYSLTFENLHNLYYSLFCSLDILPEYLKSLKLTKEVLAFTFAKLSTRKSITESISNDNITDQNYWIEQISISITADEWPDYENAKKLIGEN